MTEREVIEVAAEFLQRHGWRQVFRTTVGVVAGGRGEQGGADGIFEREAAWLYLEAKPSHSADARLSTAFVSAMGVMDKRMRTEPRRAGGGCNEPLDCFAGATRAQRLAERQRFLSEAVFAVSEYFIALPAEYRQRVREFSPGIAEMMRRHFLIIDPAAQTVTKYSGGAFGWQEHVVSLPTRVDA